MTYKELYTKYKTEALNLGLEDSAIKLLIIELSNFSFTEFYLNFDKKVPEERLKKIANAINKYLLEKVPVQYILGYTYFYGLKLNVNKSVLIPRRETEELVDYVINENKITKPKILDIGTGSGAIAIALKANIESNVTAVDISDAALEVAKENARKNNLEINFIKSDIFKNVKGRYDIIVSNPPYIAKEEIVAELVYLNEPHLALYAEADGLYYYDKILKEAKHYLEHRNMLVFEIPENKDEKLIGLVKTYYKDSDFEILKDLQAKSRILVIKNNWRW